MNISKNKYKKRKKYFSNLKSKLIWSASLFGALFLLELIFIIASLVTYNPSSLSVLFSILSPIMFLLIIAWTVLHIMIITKLSFYEYKKDSRNNDSRIIIIVFLALGVFWFILFLLLLIGIIMTFIFIKKEQEDFENKVEKETEIINSNKTNNIELN